MSVLKRSANPRGAHLLGSGLTMVASAGLAVLAASGMLAGSAAWGATPRPARIVKPDVFTPLDGGGSGTTFTLAIPSGAHCAGDSTRSPWYREYSYMVPKGTDPVSVNFKTGLPDR